MSLLSCPSLLQLSALQRYLRCHKRPKARVLSTVNEIPIDLILHLENRTSSPSLLAKELTPIESCSKHSKASREVFSTMPLSILINVVVDIEPCTIRARMLNLRSRQLDKVTLALYSTMTEVPLRLILTSHPCHENLKKKLLTYS